VVPNHQIPSSRNLGVAASADHCIVFISARINSFDVFSSREDQSVDHSQIGRFVLLNKRLQNMVSIDTKSISAEIEPVENDEPVESSEYLKRRGRRLNKPLFDGDFYGVSYDIIFGIVINVIQMWRSRG
jgi:hypothetical protein